jgi:hypothetical protein
MVAPHGEDHHRRALFVIATDRGILEMQDLSDLLSDGRKHLPGGAPRATSVARRSSACSSASRPTWSPAPTGSASMLNAARRPTAPTSPDVPILWP